MPSLSDRLIVFDAETTGTDVLLDRICELGVVCFENHIVTTRECLRINPGIPIPIEASKVHHITDAMVANKPKFSDVANRVADYLNMPPLVGYNAADFDGPLLNAEFERAGHDTRLDPAAVVDPVVFVRWHLRHVRKRQLAPMVQRFGISLENAHSAVADAEATGKLLLTLIGEGLIPDDVDDALAQQAEFAPKIREEFDRWTYWLYRDRKDGHLRMGAGKHIGVSLADMDPGYLGWMLDNIDDLPDEVRMSLDM